jgi:hypothetical protein
MCQRHLYIHHHRRRRCRQRQQFQLATLRHHHRRRQNYRFDRGTLPTLRQQYCIEHHRLALPLLARKAESSEMRSNKLNYRLLCISYKQHAGFYLNLAGSKTTTHFQSVLIRHSRHIDHYNCRHHRHPLIFRLSARQLCRYRPHHHRRRQLLHIAHWQKRYKSESLLHQHLIR